jgi:hypothetical protein
MMRHVIWAIYEANIKDSQAFRILVSLADLANDDDEAWPSVKKIADTARCCQRSVHRKLDDLVSSGLITKTNQFNGQGQSSNRYRINCPPTAKLAEGGVVTAKLAEGVTDSGVRGGLTLESDHRPLESTPSTKKERKTLPLFNGKAQQPPQPDQPSLFDQFWAAYPKKVGKPSALKAWDKAITKVKPDIIIAAAVAYAKSRVGQDDSFTKHPGPWLNDERWNAPVPSQQQQRPAGPRIVTDGII